MSQSCSVRGVCIGLSAGALIWLLAACGSDANQVIGSRSASGAGGVAGTGGGATAAGGAIAGGGATAGGGTVAGASATAGAGVGGSSANGGASAGGGSGGAAATGGSAGTAGGGSGGAAACSPGASPPVGTMFTRTDWSAQWSPPCDFSTGNGTCQTLTPEYAFDGLGTTRTSIGDTHLSGGGKVAEVIGDAFTFDMKTCNQIGKLVMFAAAPPNNNGGGVDDRDFPGAADVTVSSDCTTTNGVISGTFGSVVGTGNEPQPGCNSGSCNMPMTFIIDPPVAAKCVRISLTKVLQIGGGVWWAIDELEVYP